MNRFVILVLIVLIGYMIGARYPAIAQSIGVA